jgi:hypothetical protein
MGKALIVYYSTMIRAREAVTVKKQIIPLLKALYISLQSSG